MSEDRVHTYGEPGRTKTKAEGPDWDVEDGQDENVVEDPGRTPGKAEGTEEAAERSLRKMEQQGGQK